MSAFDVSLRNDRDQAIACYAEALAEEIGKTAAEHDVAGQFPHAHFDFLTRQGALRLTLPKALGGEGYSLYETLIFQERLARGSGSTALALGWHLMVFGYLGHTLHWPQEALARLAADVVEHGHLVNVLVTEREAGNLLRGARPGTLARRQGAGYVLDGRKAFCSSAPRLQQMIVYAWLEDEGQAAEFLVPRGPGVKVIENWNTLGMRSTGSHDIAFEQVQLPPEALLSRIVVGQQGSFTVASRAFGLQLSAVYLGIARAARDFALDFAGRHHSHSLGQAVLEAPQVQQRLGEIELLLGASKTLLYGLVERWERHPHLQARFSDEVAITKVTVSRNAIRVVELAMAIVGGHSLSRDWPLERYFRDVQCALFNPPQEDAVVSGLARAAAQRWQRQQGAAPGDGRAPASAAPAERPGVEPALVG
ncbi:MAG: acyl-CoA/acyl-ACP dehydrogenase [Curvibacter sp.]|nr:acyl-CoA/acyl-ACP dehydrogenase [Curvibacter sp.]